MRVVDNLPSEKQQSAPKTAQRTVAMLGCRHSLPVLRLFISAAKDIVKYLSLVSK